MFLTYSGKEIDFKNIKAKDICIEDIAQGLSNICRYAGQAREFCSVAQHSVRVAEAVAYSAKGEGMKNWRALSFAALLHDASEAYTSDVPSPVKYLCPDFLALEASIMTAVHKRFGVKLTKNEEALIRAEDLTDRIGEWGKTPVTAEQSKIMFLEMYLSLVQ